MVQLTIGNKHTISVFAHTHPKSRNFIVKKQAKCVSSHTIINLLIKKIFKIQIVLSHTYLVYKNTDKKVKLYSVWSKSFFCFGSTTSTRGVCCSRSCNLRFVFGTRLSNSFWLPWFDHLGLTGFYNLGLTGFYILKSASLSYWILYNIFLVFIVLHPEFLSFLASFRQSSGRTGLFFFMS